MTDRRDARSGTAGWPAWARVANNWVHDVCTGLWFACVLVVWLLVSRASGASAEAASVLDQTALTMFGIALAALFGITVTGALRLAYWRADTPSEQVASKRPMLIGKHIAFVAVYGAGTVWAWWLVR